MKYSKVRANQLKERSILPAGRQAGPPKAPSRGYSSRTFALQRKPVRRERNPILHVTSLRNRVQQTIVREQSEHVLVADTLLGKKRHEVVWQGTVRLKNTSSLSDQRGQSERKLAGTHDLNERREHMRQVATCCAVGVRTHEDAGRWLLS